MVVYNLWKFHIDSSKIETKTNLGSNTNSTVYTTEKRVAYPKPYTFYVSTIDLYFRSAIHKSVGKRVAFPKPYTFYVSTIGLYFRSAIHKSSVGKSVGRAFDHLCCTVHRGEIRDYKRTSSTTTLGELPLFV